MSKYILSTRRVKLFAGFLLTISAIFMLTLLSDYFDENTNKGKDLIASKIDQIISENPTAAGNNIETTDENDNKIEKSVIETLK